MPTRRSSTTCVTPATASASVIAIIPMFEVQNAKVASGASWRRRPVRMGVAYAIIASTSIAYAPQKAMWPCIAVTSVPCV
jgi:hypothetical protein